MSLTRSVGQITYRVIRKYGMSATLTERVTGTFSPSTNTVAVTATDHEVKVLVQEYGERERPNIRAGDKKVLVAGPALDDVPTTEWRLTVGERTFEIVHVLSHYIQDAAVVYEIQARGA